MCPSISNKDHFHKENKIKIKGEKSHIIGKRLLTDNPVHTPPHTPCPTQHIDSAELGTLFYSIRVSQLSYSQTLLYNFRLSHRPDVEMDGK